MARLLHISASPRMERSYSLRAAEAFVETYREAHPDDTVDRLDLSTADIPAFDAVAVAAKYRILHGEDAAPAEREAWKAVEAVIADFTAADKFVMSSPMWNFGVPYRLKQYFDVLVQPGLTFSYSPEEGYKGLVVGKRAMVILARGGAFAPGTPTASYDFQKPYIELILGFIGITQVETLIIEPTLQGGPEEAKRKLDEALAAAREKAKDF